ncbi:MAG: hypothetical protein WA970_25570 [Gammaproteobacteria bacterium]
MVHACASLAISTQAERSAASVGQLTNDTELRANKAHRARLRNFYALAPYFFTELMPKPVLFPACH